MAAQTALPGVLLPPPTTPKRSRKKRSTAPPLQRAGHASLTFESPPDFSTLSSGLLYSPFDSPSATSGSAVVTQTILEKQDPPARKVNSHSFANVFGSRLRHRLPGRQWQRHTADPTLNIEMLEQSRTTSQQTSKQPSIRLPQEQQSSYHSLGAGFFAGRSGASSRQSRRSELSDTSKTLLALFPLPPKLVAPSPGGSSSQGTPNEPKTPDPLFSFEAPTLAIELNNTVDQQAMESHDTSIQPIARTYSLPKPPPRPKKAPVMTKSTNDLAAAHVTPPRAIFADYATAFQSIRSKSARDLNEVPTSNHDMPLPPVPALLQQTPESSATRKASDLNQRAKSLARSLSAKHHAALAKSCYSTQSLAKHRRASVHPAKVFARFSMPAAITTTNKSMNDDDDDVLLLSSSSSPHDGSNTSQSSFRGSDQGSHSSHPESNDPAEKLIESYIRKDELSHSNSFRRYSALPRLQTTRSVRTTDDTVSTIGDLLSQYGDPEYRSLPPSVSQRLDHKHEANSQPNNHTGALTNNVPDVAPTALASRAGATFNGNHNPFEDAQDGLHDEEVISKPQPVLLADNLRPTEATAGDLALTFFNSSAPLTDYGDTRELLQLSSSSIDIGRNLEHDRLSAAGSTSSGDSWLDVDDMLHHQATGDNFFLQEKSSDLELTRNANHSTAAHSPPQTLIPEKHEPVMSLSGGASGASTATHDAGAGFHPGSAAGKKSDLNPFRKSSSAATEAPSKPVPAAWPDQLSQYFAEQNLVSGLMSNIYNKQPTTAAFGAKDVQPGFFRYSPAKEPGRSALAQQQKQEPTVSNSLEHSSSFSDEHEDEDNDWETVAESHRTLAGPASVAHSDGFADNHSLNASNTATRIGFHLADQRFKHTYRLHSPTNSAEPVYLPTYDLGGSSSFPYINASSALSSSAYFPQSHLQPSFNSLNTHGGPPDQALFPPSAFSQTSLESVSFDEEEFDDRPVPYGVWRGPNLSVVYEQSGERSSASEVDEVAKTLAPPSVIGTVSRLEDDMDASSAWVSCVPGQEVSSTGDESAWQHTGTRLGARTRSMILASGADASLIKTLRQDDGRMPSSPLSDTNSFAKVSKLGPHANITGSINGTNMRYVGSSLVGTSSPVVSPKSVSSSVQNTPRRLEAPFPAHEPSSSLVEEFSTPAPRSHIPRPTSYMIPKEKRSMLLPTARPSSNHTVQLLSPTHVDGHFSRQPSFSSQKTLEGLNLGIGQLSEAGKSTLQPREPFQRIAPQRHNSTAPAPASSIRNIQTPHTLLPRPQEGAWSPHLHRPRRPPSSQVSDVRTLKERLSWAAFAICLFFPPLLIFFGHGLFDGLMWTISRRRVEHFGRRQKAIGKVLGYFVTGAVCLGLGIALIVIHTVPNNLPR